MDNLTLWDEPIEAIYMANGRVITSNPNAGGYKTLQLVSMGETAWVVEGDSGYDEVARHNCRYITSIKWH